MKIIIDADACPKGVKTVCEAVSAQEKLELVMVIDTAHELKGDFKVITVDKGNDAVDLVIANIIEKNDIVITQDYGLATMLMEKAGAIINPKGFLYTKFNIDSLMFQRYMGQKIRQSGGRVKGPKKREKKDDENFKKVLLEYLEGIQKRGN